MRCKMCDFDPSNSDSVYQSGVVNKHSKENKLIVDPDTGEYICLDCNLEIYYDTFESAGIIDFGFDLEK